MSAADLGERVPVTMFLSTLEADMLEQTMEQLKKVGYDEHAAADAICKLGVIAMTSTLEFVCTLHLPDKN